MIRVLVADDSPLFAEAMAEVLIRDAELDVCGVADNGAQAVKLASQLRPDMIIMDVKMPIMGGLEAIEEIMRLCPTPILVMTSDPRGESGELSFEALRRGALDLVVKPSVWPTPEPEQEALRQHIKLLAGVKVVRHGRRRRLDSGPTSVSDTSEAVGFAQVVAIVASTGGPAALATILSGLPSDYPMGLLAVQHLAQGFAPRLATWLDGVSGVRVRLAQAGDAVEPGTMLLAPDEVHLVVDGRGRVAFDTGDAVDGHRPSGNLLLASVARFYRHRALGVVLTGMGSDGVDGLLAMRQTGAVTIAQDEQSSVVYGMPRMARERGAASAVLSLGEIARELRWRGKQAAALLSRRES